MDYKEIYDAALERAKKLQGTCDSTAVLGWCEYIFPELKESEDEKIKRELRNDLLLYVPTPERYIAWLEKQGKHAEVEPKFNVGDWITDGDINIFQITKIDIDNEWYYADDGDRVCFDVVHDYYHLWTINDAKDGDVLASELTGSIFLFKGIKDNKIDFYCDYDTKLEWLEHRFGINDSSEHYGSVEESQDIHPATKEQRDTLIKAMANAGYTFDFEKKEFKEIEPKTLDAGKVIEWLNDQACQGWIEDVEVDIFVDKFKKDFGL